MSRPASRRPIVIVAKKPNTASNDRVSRSVPPHGPVSIPSASAPPLDNTGLDVPSPQPGIGFQAAPPCAGGDELAAHLLSGTP
jgi:hypothetical protein